MIRRLFPAIPVMNEGAFLPATLRSLACQTSLPAKVYVCVNQPDAWHAGTEAQRKVCLDNRETLAWLRNYKALDLVVLDRSSPGKGWQGKRSGAGWARKILLDAVNLGAAEGDILVSMDGDTDYESHYLQSVLDAFDVRPDAVALSAPFYHRLGPAENENRALLRYELYMRHYFLQLARIGSPYAFIALGSAIALPVWAYRKVRGITPFKAGEDFYFLQKLAKVGKILNDCGSVVYPSARLSDRVDFGTGPAMLKGLSGNWDAYPFFPESSFNALHATYELFPLLYDGHRATPLDPFLETHFGTADIWTPLRKNFRSRAHFVRACHGRIDGLRIRQYLGFARKQAALYRSDEDVLMEFVHCHLERGSPSASAFDRMSFSFERSPLALLDDLRNLFFSHESGVRSRQEAALFA